MVFKLSDGVVNNDLADKFQTILKWIDYNLLPIIAWPILLGFAAVGIYGYLGNVNSGWKVGLAIGIAAFIGFKAHKQFQLEIDTVTV